MLIFEFETTSVHPETKTRKKGEVKIFFKLIKISQPFYFHTLILIITRRLMPDLPSINNINYKNDSP